MAPTPRLSGVLAPVITPFCANLAADARRLSDQCRWLLSQDVGLAVFGTNSEANSLSTPEKIELLERLLDAGIDPARMIPGTGCCAFTDTVQLTRRAVALGCAGVLMLPPFYYKDVSDEGLFRCFAEIIERVGSDALRIYLYHIPPVSNVGLSLDLVARLIDAYPDQIAGIKDSSGDWSNTSALLNQGWPGFRIFAGSENFLLRVMRNGGAGCISATANINPGAIHKLYREWKSGEAERQQSTLNDLRELLQQFPMIPALKAVVAHYAGDPSWRRVRPPLVELDDTGNARLIRRLQELGFEMPGLSATHSG